MIIVFACLTEFVHSDMWQAFPHRQMCAYFHCIRGSCLCFFLLWNNDSKPIWADMFLWHSFILCHVFSLLVFLYLVLLVLFWGLSEVHGTVLDRQWKSQGKSGCTIICEYSHRKIKEAIFVMFCYWYLKHCMEQSSDLGLYFSPDRLSFKVLMFALFALAVQKPTFLSLISPHSRDLGEYADASHHAEIQGQPGCNTQCQPQPGYLHQGQ